MDDIGKMTGVAEPLQLVFCKTEEGQPMPAPTLKLSSPQTREFFQGLCNALANLGYAPDTSRLAGELDATKAHLECEKQMHQRTFALLESSVMKAITMP